MKQLLIVAAIALIIGAGSAYKAQDWRYEALIAAIHAQHATASQQAVTDALEQQQRLNASTETIGAKGDEVNQAVLTEYAVSNDGSDRVREELARVRASAIRENSRLATKWATAAATVEALTRLLEELTGFAGEAAYGADDARARGLTCERAYDGVRGEQ